MMTNACKRIYEGVLKSSYDDIKSDISDYVDQLGLTTATLTELLYKAARETILKNKHERILDSP